MPGVRTIVVSLFAVITCGAIAARADEAVNVALNQARILRMPEKTKTIVIGNPMIADVTMQRNNNLVLTGKTYGSTNLIALDDKGNIVADRKSGSKGSRQTFCMSSAEWTVKLIPALRSANRRSASAMA